MLQNKPMTEIVKFNLPKVQIRVKTTASNTLQSQASQTYFKEFSHPLLKERLKMKKEIQESYMRSRRHKKNNYIKQNSSSKRCSPNPEEKRGLTIQVKNKRNTEDRIDFALQVNGIQNQVVKNRRSQHANATSLMRKSKEASQKHNREFLASSCKPNDSKKNFLSKHFSLYYSELCTEKKQTLELQGEKWNYNKFSKTKRVLSNFVKLNTMKHQNASGKASSFKIDAWKADRISRSKDYQIYQTNLD